LPLLPLANTVTDTAIAREYLERRFRDSNKVVNGEGSNWQLVIGSW
jgi:hypothetical protein